MAISATPAGTATLGGSSPTHTALHDELRTALNSANTWTGLGTFGTLAITGATVTFAAGTDIVLDGAGAGTKIGTATTQKLGFYNATPIVQPAALTQTYSTADATLGNLTAADLTDNSGGTSGGTTIAAVVAADVDTTAAGLATTKNAVATLAAMVDKNTADHADLAQFVNSAVDKLQALGLIAV